MKLKDLKVKQKVWFSTSREELRKGGGEQVTVHAIGRYIRTWEPCGSLITPTTAPGSTMTVIKFAEANKHDRMLARFGKESSSLQFRLVEGGRYLMHEDEHKIHRAAAADRQLEVDAWQQRGTALRERAEELIRKGAIELGFSAELVKVNFWQRQAWDSKRRKYVYEPDVSITVDDDAVLKLVTTPELRQVMRDHAAWKDTPKPGSVC